MSQLNEYQVINNDEDLAKWKTTWAPDQPIPHEVHTYMRTVVMPRTAKQIREFTNSIFTK
jgi:hypothetical protein